MADMVTHVERYTCSSHKKIAQLFEPFQRKFGLNFFNYHAISSDGKYTALTSRPDVSEHYVTKKLYLLDPLLVHPKHFGEGAFFYHSLGHEALLKFFSSFQKNFEMDYPFGLVMKSSNPEYEFEFFGFTAATQNSTVLNSYVNELSAFYKFCNYFRSEGASLIKQAHNDPIDLLAIDKSRFFQGLPIELCPSKEKKKDPSEKDVLLTRSKDLSDRERICLRWMVAGKTAFEIGIILGISGRTAEKHIENALKKLDIPLNRTGAAFLLGKYQLIDEV